MKRIYRVESILGGSNFYDEGGNHIGYSIPGIGGGEDYFFSNGETGYTVDSVINGQDYNGSDGVHAHTIESVFGGEEIHGDVSGFGVDSIISRGKDIFLDDQHEKGKG